MKLRFSILLAVPLLTAGCGQPDPIHEGRPVSRWIERLDAKETAHVQSAVEALLACGEPALPRVTAALANADEQIRTGAALVLLQSGPDARKCVLEGFEQARDPLVQLSLARAILALGVECPAAVHIVMANLKHPDDKVRHEATHALGDLTSESGAAVAVLAEYLASEDGDQRYHSALSLIRIGPAAAAATPALIKALHDADARVRQGAVQALAAIGEPARAAMPALVALRDDPSDEVRWQAGEVLKAWQIQ